MELMEGILSRRSIRQYTEQQVPAEVITGLLTAAMSAPSASNRRPWYFVVISDRQTLSEIPKHHEYSGMLRQASCAIAVCGDLELDDGRGFWVQDCSAATENILLAAHANGLGAVWLGVYPIERRVAGIKSLLGLPENIVPLSLVSLGYPAERRLHTNRYDAARVRYDHW